MNTKHARKGVLERGSEKGQEGKRMFFPKSLVNKTRDVSWDSETRQSSQDMFEIYNLLCKSQFYSFPNKIGGFCEEILMV